MQQNISLFQVTINPDGTFTVDITDSPAGNTPFKEVTVTVDVPGGSTVEQLTTTACVHPCKWFIIW